MTKYITVTETAKLIRSDLKKHFPNIKFSVRSKSYSMGASIDISYSGNVTQETVMSVTNKYRGSGFDAMQDLKYGVTGELNGEEVHFGSDHVFVSRHFVADEVQKFADFISEHYNFEDAITGNTTKPKYEVTVSEWSGASVRPLNNTMFGSRYFESFVSYTMHSYTDFEQFIKLEHLEYYDELFPQAAPTPQIEQVSYDGIEVKLDREWTWVLGVTDVNIVVQEKLLSMGFRWSRKRQQWYSTDNKVNEVMEALKTM